MKLSNQLLNSPEEFLQTQDEETVKIALTEIMEKVDKFNNSDTLCVLAQCLKVHPYHWLYVMEHLDGEYPPFQCLIQNAENEPSPKKRRTEGKIFLTDFLEL